MFVVHRLELAMINLHTKFEVSVFTHYTDMKGNENVETGGRVGITQGHRECHHSIERIQVLIRL